MLTASSENFQKICVVNIRCICDVFVWKGNLWCRGDYPQLRGGCDVENWRVLLYCKMCSIFLGGEHRSDWVTTFPFSEICDSAKHIPGHPRTKGDIVIGNDVWIGYEALIMSGVYNW